MNVGADKNETICDTKAKIHEIPEQQRFLLNCRQLEDNHTLSYHKMAKVQVRSPFAPDVTTVRNQSPI
jgi:hypothetical protein